MKKRIAVAMMTLVILFNFISPVLVKAQTIHEVERVPYIMDKDFIGFEPMSITLSAVLYALAMTMLAAGGAAAVRTANWTETGPIVFGNDFWSANIEGLDTPLIESQFGAILRRRRQAINPATNEIMYVVPMTVNEYAVMMNSMRIGVSDFIGPVDWSIPSDHWITNPFWWVTIATNNTHILPQFTEQEIWFYLFDWNRATQGTFPNNMFTNQQVFYQDLVNLMARMTTTTSFVMNGNEYTVEFETQHHNSWARSYRPVLMRNGVPIERSFIITGHTANLVHENSIWDGGDFNDTLVPLGWGLINWDGHLGTTLESRIRYFVAIRRFDRWQQIGGMNDGYGWFLRPIDFGSIPPF
jgi:hypothetical protein